MSQYRNINQPTTNFQNKRKFTTTRYPQIPLSDDDIQVLTDSGDRLDNLAFQFYGDTSYWIWIVLANPNKTSRDSYFVEPGTQLRIPANINGIISNFKSLNQ